MPPPKDWPLFDTSQMIRGPVHDWHVQRMGTGPDLLLLHGAGGSTHSFRAMIPLLAQDFSVTAIDLPGHGYTRLGRQRRSGLQAMAADISGLSDHLNLSLTGIIGHSAGVAIALEMSKHRPDIRVIGINPALGHFEGIAGVVFPAMAKLLAAVPFTAKLFSNLSARPDRIRALIDSTGSNLDEQGLDLYRRLVAHEPHVAGALAMMAQWSLDSLLPNLSSLPTQTLFITGANDKTVPPQVAKNAVKQMMHAELQNIDGFGHLIHEEIPDQIAEICSAFLRA